jgi:hypothetical protein
VPRQEKRVGTACGYCSRKIEFRKTFAFDLLNWDAYCTLALAKERYAMPSVHSQKLTQVETFIAEYIGGKNNG